MFFKIRFLKNLAKFTWKHLSQSLFFNKVSGLMPQDCNYIKKKILAQVFSCEFLEHVCWFLLKLRYKSGFPDGFQYTCNFLTKIFNWSSLHWVCGVTKKLVVWVIFNAPPILQQTADLVTITEETLNGKFHFLCNAFLKYTR